MRALQGKLRAEGAAGKYRIVLQLGQGGTADVYLAVADGPGGFRKLVVLKVLKESFRGDDEFRAMFLNEARLAARLQHPNVVQTNEVLELDGEPIMVMEYLEGQPLSQVIVRGKQGRFSLAMQIRVLIDALAGLHAAHELADFDGTPLGVVHRDVSPQNLFVTTDGHAKVLDFGIAKLDRSIVETEVGTIKGKLRYMAPEQIAGERLDRRADVYAAGVILWEALVGERMWKGLPEQEIRTRIKTGELPMPRVVRPDVAACLDEVCRRALSLCPADRYATAEDLADDLEVAASALGGLASHREIGAAVAALFHDVRAATREAIEQKISGMSASWVPEGLAVPETTETSTAPRAVAERTGARTGEGTDEGTDEGTAVPTSTATRSSGSFSRAPGDRSGGWTANPRRARRRVLFALAGATGAALLLLGASMGFRLFAGRHAANAAAVAPPARTVTSTSAVPLAPVAVPPRLSPERPARAGAAPSPSLVDATSSDPRAWRDARNSPGRSTPKRARQLAASGAAPSPRAPAPTTGCDHPFFVDGDGIKKFRPECM